MEPISNEQVQTLLTQSIDNATIDVQGDGYKYLVTVISDSFEGKNTLQRHKTIYAVLNEPIAAGLLHALTIKAYTHTEWEQQQ